MATNGKKRSELRFLVKTGMDGFKPEDRKIIRSHVMKGKNLGRIRPLGSRKHLTSIEAPENTVVLSSGSGADNYDNINGVTSLSRVPSTPYPENSTSMQALESIPPRVGLAASTMYLADAVKPATFEVVLQFSSIAKPLLFPMEPCIFFDRRAENWIAPLATDPAFLHAQIFTSLYFYDAVLPRRRFRESQCIRHHYHKAVGLLRERLLCSDKDKRLSNITISIVLCFAGQAFCSGDLNSAVNHIHGIRRMVDLRGGFSSITGNEKLIVEIMRCDLGIAVHSGSDPILCRGTASSHDIYRMYPKLDLFLDRSGVERALRSHEFLTSHALTHGVEIHDELAAAWNAMSDFCAVINLAADLERRIDVGTFLRSMTSIMYNLLDMRFESSSWNETIRLGLLSFSCSVFLPWTRLGISYPYLKSILRNNLAELAKTIPPFPPKLILWLLMACAVTFFDEFDDPWIHDLFLKATDLCGIQSWGQMREMLNSLMWIGIVHDKLGKRVFDAVMSHSKA